MALSGTLAPDSLQKQFYPAKPAKGASLTPGMDVLAHSYGQSIEGGSQPSAGVPLGGAPLYCRDGYAWRILSVKP